MKIRRKLIVPIIIVMACLLSGCKIGDKEYVVHEPKEEENHSLFSINEQKCELPEAMIYLCNYKCLYGSEYGLDLWSYDFKEESLESYVKALALDEYIRVTCMDNLAAEHEMTLDETETACVTETAKAYYDSLSAEEIAFMGISEKDVENAYAHYALAMKLYQTLTDGVEKEVSDDEARVMRIQQIYITNAENAEIVAGKLLDGDDFATVAATYNEAESVETMVARGDLPEAVEKEAFNLDNGEFTGQIEADDAYYFVRCLNKFEEDLTEANKDVIREKREKEQFEDMYDNYVANAVFVMNEAMWDEVTLEGNEDILKSSDFFQMYLEHFEK